MDMFINVAKENSLWRFLCTFEISKILTEFKKKNNNLTMSFFQNPDSEPRLQPAVGTTQKIRGSVQ
jgi:hypothetical protein